MKLPRRRFLQLAAGGAALRGRRTRSGLGASLSGAAGALHGRLSRPAAATDIFGAPDRPVAVGAARPAIRRREPAGRRQQYRHRGGRARAGRRLHAAAGRRRRPPSTRRSTTISTSISSATSRRSRASIRVPLVMVVNPSFPAKTVPEFIAYAKANPGKINMASAGNGTPDPCRRRAVQDDGRRRHAARALSRRRRRRSPICSAGRCRSCSAACRRRSSTSGPASCARWR